MKMCRHKFRLVLIALGTLLGMLLAGTLLLRHKEDWCSFGIKCCDLLGQFAQRFGYISLENLAWTKRSEYFQASLDLEIEGGELAVVPVPAESRLDPRSFNSDLTQYAGSNKLEIVFMRFETNTNGLTSGRFMCALRTRMPYGRMWNRERQC